MSVSFTVGVASATFVHVIVVCVAHVAVMMCVRVVNVVPFVVFDADVVSAIVYGYVMCYVSCVSVL